MKYLTVEEVIKLHGKLMIRYGGSFGIRDMGLLKSSVESIFQTFGGENFILMI